MITMTNLFAITKSAVLGVIAVKMTRISAQLIRIPCHSVTADIISVFDDVCCSVAERF